MTQTAEDAAALLADVHAATTTDNDGRFTVTELMEYYEHKGQRHGRPWVEDRVRALLRGGRVERCTKRIFSELSGHHTTVRAYRAKPEEEKGAS